MSPGVGIDRVQRPLGGWLWSLRGLGILGDASCGSCCARFGLRNATTPSKSTFVGLALGHNDILKRSIELARHLDKVLSNR